MTYAHSPTSTIKQIKNFMFKTEIHQRMVNCSEDRLVFTDKDKDGIMEDLNTANQFTNSKFTKPVNVTVTCKPEPAAQPGPAPVAPSPAPQAIAAAAKANELPIGWTQMVAPGERTYYSYQYEKIRQFNIPKLPENWIQNIDPQSNRPYYVNQVTGQSVWPWPGPKEEGPILEAAPVEAPKTVEGAKPVEAAKTVEAAAPVEAAKTVEAPKPEEAPVASNPEAAPVPVKTTVTVGGGSKKIRRRKKTIKKKCSACTCTGHGTGKSKNSGKRPRRP